MNHGVIQTWDGKRGEGNEREHAVTELVKVQALKRIKNTRTAEIQYYYLYYIVYMMILSILDFKNY